MSDHPEADPTAIEPDEAELPPKPPIEDMPEGDEGDDPPSDEDEQDIPDEQFLDDKTAEADDSVDDAEADPGP